jgi:hypothetical protein
LSVRNAKLTFMREPPFCRFLLILPFFLSCAIYGYFWVSKGCYALTGDEPHYLLIAESLLRDRDIDLKNNYFENRFDLPIRPDQMAGGGHISIGGKIWAPIHGLGLPILLSFPFSIGGELGATFALLLLAGAIPFLLFGLTSELALPSWKKATLVLLACVTLPLLAGSNQIYPDLITGFAILVPLILLFQGFESKRGISVGGFFFGGFCISVLFWLHVKNLPSAIFLFLGLGGVGIMRRRYRELLLTAWLFLPSLIAFFIYNGRTYGNLLGPVTESSLVFDPPRNLAVAFAIHLDQFHGMFMQNPFLLLGFVGLFPLWNLHRRFAVLLGLVYLAQVLPNTLHPNWFGGHSFAGRFGWSVMFLWFFPIMAFIQEEGLIKSNLLFILLSLIFFGYQLRIDWWGLSQPGYLYNHGFITDPRLSRTLFPELQAYLPNFQYLPAMFTHWPNFWGIVLSVGTVFMGFAIQRLRKHIVWIAFLFLFCFFFIILLTIRI